MNFQYKLRGIQFKDFSRESQDLIEERDRDIESAFGYNFLNLDASNLTIGTVPSARMTGSYTGITGLGTLTALTVDGPSSSALTFGDWSTTPAYSAIEGNMGYLLLGKNALDDFAVYLRTNNSVGGVNIGANNTTILNVNVNGINVVGTATISGSSTIGAQSDVAGRFSTSGGAAGLLVGSLGGTAPFVGTGAGYPLTLNTNGVARVQISSAGNVGIGTATPSTTLHVVGSFSRGAPVTKTASFTLADSENWIICNGTGSITVTLPAASTQVGREISLKNIAAFTVVSASSNVVPLVGGAAGTAILPATAGSWATLVSDGTNWIIMQS